MTKYLFIAFLLLSVGSLAQVKIGGAPGAAHPNAVLELDDTARGFLLPRLSQAQMQAMATPPDGLLIYNTTSQNIYQYKATPAQWQALRTDSSEWATDTASAKLYLRRGLANGDTIYYNVAKKKFIFSDTRFLGTSSNNTSLFNIDEGSNDKYVFKLISSQLPKDTANPNSAAVYVAHEIDNEPAFLSRPFESSYFGIANSTVINRRVTQRVGVAHGLYSTLTNGAQDTVSGMNGITSFVVGRSRAYTQIMTGISNNVQFGDSALANVGQVTGIRNGLSFNALSTIKVDGSYFGYQGFMPNTPGRVLGSAYGIFLSNVNLAGQGNNFAINTARGYNRFGDSTVVTDIFAARPRAVFDINATSAMILPAGSNAQRPTTLYNGMLRYNTETGSPEAYTASGWANLKNPVLSATALLDCPQIATNSSVTVTYTFTGAAVGNVVAVSPAAALPSGLSIAWARVNNPNQLDICFGNYSGALIDPPAQTFYIKVIQ
jgi:hypothetical protein